MNTPTQPFKDFSYVMSDFYYGLDGQAPNSILRKLKGIEKKTESTERHRLSIVTQFVWEKVFPLFQEQANKCSFGEEWKNAINNKNIYELSGIRNALRWKLINRKIKKSDEYIIDEIVAAIGIFENYLKTDRPYLAARITEIVLSASVDRTGDIKKNMRKLWKTLNLCDVFECMA